MRLTRQQARAPVSARARHMPSQCIPLNIVFEAARRKPFFFYFFFFFVFFVLFLFFADYTLHTTRSVVHT